MARATPDLTRRQWLIVLGVAGVAASCNRSDAVADAEPPATSTTAATASASPSSTKKPSSTKGTTNPPTAKPTPTPTPTPSVPPGAVSAGGFDEAAAATLGREIAGLVAGSKVAIGVGLRDVGSGRTFVYSSAPTFQLASSVKVDILVATMIKARDGGGSLTATQRAQATTMIRNSDNTAAMAMFNAMGRATGMDKMYARMGMAHTKAGPGGWWGTSTSSVADRLQLMSHVAGHGTVLHPDDAAFILGLMRSVQAGQRWGAGQVGAAGETVAVKNGWVTDSDDGNRWIICTEGIITAGGKELLLTALTRSNSSQGAGVSRVTQSLAKARATLGV